MYDSAKPYKTKIEECIQQTWETDYCTVEKHGIYPAIRKKNTKDNLKGYEISHTDGMGTKGIYHWANRSFNHAVTDALCMNLNDLLMAKAYPYSIQNHLFLPEDDHKAIEEIMFEMSVLCKQQKIAITGGETSIHNNMQGMEISITMNGFIKDKDIDFKNKIKDGDVILGYSSNGLHSNGFTKVRELIPLESIITKKLALDLICSPTRNYTIHNNLRSNYINGMMHMTGGSFTKIKDILPLDLDAHFIRLDRVESESFPIFKKLYNKIKDDKEMYKTFNCGVGFIFTTSINNVDKFEKDGYVIIGNVTKGRGEVIINSRFSDNIVKF